MFMWMVNMSSYLFGIQQVKKEEEREEGCADMKKKGQEEFDRIRSLSYNDTHAIMICFSVDNKDSLENIPNRWMEELEEGCPRAKIILVALKCDLREDEATLKRCDPILYKQVG